MIRISELQEKDIINCTDGRYLGSLRDIEIDLTTGKIRNIFLISPTPVGFMKKKEPIAVAWHEIRKIGIDVILVERLGHNVPRGLLEEHNP